MTIVFLSNYLNHHSLPLCKALMNISNDNFYFVATKTVSEQRQKLGYEDINSKYDFVVRAYEDSQYERAMKLCLECDVLIYGMVSESMITPRLKKGNLTFKYTERVYKVPCSKFQLPLRRIKYLTNYDRYKSLYLLCASAYTSGDYAKTGTFLNKAFKWGYFPETKEHDDIKNLVASKDKNTLLWVARLIDWKHPELALEIAKRLKNDGYDFTLNIIGTGEMEEEISRSIEELSLGDCVKLLGSMKPHEVRDYMEKSKVFLMTSDRKEGWGAVLNEAMNSGCAIVANSAAGSAPYLISDGENGFLYNENNIDDMYNKVKYLLDNPDLAYDLGEKAYYTITEQWNAENAAKRFLKLSENLLLGNNGKDLFKDGVCSYAYPIKDNWYKVNDGEL